MAEKNSELRYNIKEAYQIQKNIGTGNTLMILQFKLVSGKHWYKTIQRSREGKQTLYYLHETEDNQDKKSRSIESDEVIIVQFQTLQKISKIQE